MAGRPIVFEFVADATRFLRGAKQVETELDDVADALEDAAKEGDTLERKLGEAFREVERDAARAGDRVGREFGDKSSDTFAKVGGEAGREFTSNLSEAVSSGDLSTLASDVAGGLIGGLEGIGTKAGIAIGAGLTAAAVGFNVIQNAWQRRAERIEESINRLRALFIEVEGDLSRIDWAAQIRELGEEEWFAGALAQADELGLNLTDVGEALAGNVDKGGPLLQQLKDMVAEGTTLEWNGRAYTKVVTEQGGKARLLLQLLREQGGLSEKSLEGQRLINEALGLGNDELGSQATKVGELRDKKNEELQEYREILGTAGATTTEIARAKDEAVKAKKAYREARTELELMEGAADRAAGSVAWLAEQAGVAARSLGAARDAANGIRPYPGTGPWVAV